MSGKRKWGRWVGQRGDPGPWSRCHIDLHGATLTEDANFWDATFTADANFRKVTFSQLFIPLFDDSFPHEDNGLPVGAKWAENDPGESGDV